MYGNDRNQMRQVFLDAWEKSQSGLPLDALQQMIAGVIREHPEYHALLADRERALSSDFTPEAGESNPFLHMAMHISLQEQLSTDRPQGIVMRYRMLIERLADPHAVEHRLMECLGQVLWEAQRNNRMPDEQAYIRYLDELISRL